MRKLTTEERLKRNVEGAARGAYKRQLALDWVRVHRTDVLEVIEREAVKRYPLSSQRRSPKVPLPAALAKME